MIHTGSVIFCGGSGTRLWPLSRLGSPKQFLRLTKKKSLFQEAAKRLMALVGGDFDVCAPYVVANEEHRFLALEQLREIGVEPGAALLEPAGRNAAPALTLAALTAVENGDDPVLVVTSADQTVVNASAYASAMHDAIRQTADGVIAILGVIPDRPETGYGYIKAVVAPTATYAVERFVEKPNEAKARQYLSKDSYYRNAGMFVLKASVWLQTITSFRPDIADVTRSARAKRSSDAALVRPGKAEIKAITSESIDYAAKEHCLGSSFPIRMVPLNADWSELGRMGCRLERAAQRRNGNAHSGEVLTTDSHNMLVNASSRLVSLMGVESLIVVETPDAVLIADKSCCQGVKNFVKALRRQRWKEHSLHGKICRPWGRYDSIDEGGRFKVKRIQLKPKASLNLQKHHHRAEHWMVATGTAEITCGAKSFCSLKTRLPTSHSERCIAWPTPTQIRWKSSRCNREGYLGEDDILRLEDHCGRTKE